MITPAVNPKIRRPIHVAMSRSPPMQAKEWPCPQPAQCLSGRKSANFCFYSLIRRLRGIGSACRDFFVCLNWGAMASKYVHEGTDTPRLLLQRTAAGDKEAFPALYRLYGPRVMAVVRKRVAEPELAEELVQDVFVAAWQSARGFRADLGDPELWLLGITQHKLHDHWRRLKRIAQAVGVPWDLEARESMPQPEVRLSIAQALYILSTDQRRVIDLIYAAGLTYSEAAPV